MNSKRFIIIITLLAFSAGLFSQAPKEIFIECDPDDFDYIYENYLEDIYIPVSLTHAGVTWPDVMMRIRGDSSREYPKKSLKVQFDADPFTNGKYTVNFNAEYHDLSYMHSVLSSMLFHKAGIPSPDMEHVRLYINGEFFGLYIMTENMDDQFLEANGMDPEGILYKASLDGACLSIFDNVFYHWQLNNGSDPYREQLSGLIDDLNDPGQDFDALVQSAFEYSNVLNFITMNMLISNGSTYYHNYFIFKDGTTGKWSVFPWDLDRTFTDYGVWYPYHRSSGTWTPDNPLLERSLLDEALFSEIRQNVQDLNASFVNQDFLFPVIDSIHDLIKVSVEEDTTDNIPGLQTWQDKIALDKEYILARPQYLSSQFSHHPYTFSVDRKEGYVLPGQDVQFTWQASSDPDNDPVTYTFYVGPDPIFENPATVKVEGITGLEWTLQSPEEPGKYYWMVEATDGDNVVQGFDTRNELFVSQGVPAIVINEINYNSGPDFDPGDWIEFYNPGTETVNMSGWKFMDEDNAHVFLFPYGTMLGPDGYLVLCRSTDLFFTLFPSTLPAIGNMDFGFDGNGELLRLYDGTGYLVDALLYKNEYPWPPEADGNGPTLELLNPGLDNAMGYNWAASDLHGTPGEKNGKYSPDFIGEQFPGSSMVVNVFPNPCKDQLAIVLEKAGPDPDQLRIMDIHGKVLEARSVAGQKELILDTGNLVPGVYYGFISFSGGGASAFIFVRQ